MDKILIIGAAGQLGQCLKAVAISRSISEIVFPAETEADILKPNLLDDMFKKHKPKYVVNCAAYTAVDNAEDAVELCRAINETGAVNLATACTVHGATLIHVSTDFVFEGNEVKLWNEDDIANPVNVYGKTKLAGEFAIAQIMENYFVLRTSWLYSEYGSNFVKTMLKLGSERSQLGIIADQVGTPTYAFDLADAIFKVIQSNSKDYGIYHYSNEGVTSWYDFAKAIFALSGTEVTLTPIPSSAYPTKAKRPAFSVMNKSKIKNTFNLEIPYWSDSLKVCIDKING